MDERVKCKKAEQCDYSQCPHYGWHEKGFPECFGICHHNDLEGQCMTQYEVDYEKGEPERRKKAQEAKEAYTKWWVGHLERMGLKELELSFNAKNCGPFVLHWIPDVDKHDFRWLCNRAGEMHKDYDGDCMDSTRLCRIDGEKGEATKEYLDTISCCGTFDGRMHNKVTGNWFMMGCNYGH